MESKVISRKVGLLLSFLYRSFFARFVLLNVLVSVICIWLIWSF